MQENHTFDNFFGTFPGVNGIQNDPPSVHPFHITTPITSDLCHSWTCAHVSYDDGKMDGFLKAARTNQTFGYYNGSDIPYYWALAKNYTLFLTTTIRRSWVRAFRIMCIWWQARTEASPTTRSPPSRSIQ